MELLDTTETLAAHYSSTPFFLFDQDTDEVIMIINHYIKKGEREGIVKDKPKAEKDNFWDF